MKTDWLHWLVQAAVVVKLRCYKDTTLFFFRIFEWQEEFLPLLMLAAGKYSLPTTKEIIYLLKLNTVLKIINALCKTVQKMNTGRAPHKECCCLRRAKEKNNSILFKKFCNIKPSMSWRQYIRGRNDWGLCRSSWISATETTETDAVLLNEGTR